MPIPNTLPQGTYVVFGEFAENWKPSAGAASTQRLSATQGWVLTEDTLNAIPTQYQGAVRGQWVELNADGSFEWTATLQDRDASKPAPVDGSYGVFTYAAGGVTNAAQEQEVRLNYGAPIVKTSTSLQADVESVRAGAEVTLTADVTPADQAGTVQFSNGSAALGEPVEVVDGVATLTTTDLPLGANKITAEFVPANAADVIGSKSDAVTVTVAAQPTITIDGEKPAAVTVRQGEPIEFAGGPFTAGSEFEVWIDAAGAMQPVSLSSVAAEAAEDAVPLKVGDVTVDGSGMAAITWNVPADFAPGEYVVSFRGTNVEEYLDADFTVSQYVRSTTTLTSSAGVGGSPNGVEFVATIAPETATGEVTFTNNGVAFATVPVANGTASATADLAVGSNEIVATFASSDATVSDSVSDALVITVTGSGSGADGAADGGADGSGSAGTGANGGGTGAGTIDAVVTKPAAGAKGLASTGGAEFAGLLAGGALALLLGAGLMVARRRIAAN
ncbi:Ig-like domain-containing protein [Leucobacter chromiiresistens]|uniref:Ig-like domain-containing protein n=1 Tax=Leucobacter chromiiresistens TaxID=1079994 RepID=UPI0023DDA156|nr:Ig-like domain-containing protein [Leucobacter chromiiresistens]